jgi:hypothetical protein
MVPGFAVLAPHESSAKVTLPSPAAKFERRPRAKPNRFENTKSGSGAGTTLPKIRNLQWERNRRGGWEAWHAPEGATERIHKTYLGYLGKRKLAVWFRDYLDHELRAVLEQWVAERRAEKGIT